METTSGPRFITPTLQGTLIMALREAFVAYVKGDVFITWTVLDGLFKILPPDCYKECLDDYNKIVEELNQAKTNIRQDDVTLRQATITNQIARVLRRHNGAFFRKTYTSLFKGGYLERANTRVDKDSFKRLEIENEAQMDSGQS